MGAVAKRGQDKTLQPDESIIERWGETAFLIKGKNRHGRTIYTVRMVIGENDPWRFSPVTTKAEAEKEFDRLITAIQEAVADVPGEMGGEYAGNCEW